MSTKKTPLTVVFVTTLSSVSDSQRSTPNTVVFAGGSQAWNNLPQKGFQSSVTGVANTSAALSLLDDLYTIVKRKKPVTCQSGMTWTISARVVTVVGPSEPFSKFKVDSTGNGTFTFEASAVLSTPATNDAPAPGLLSVVTNVTSKAPAPVADLTATVKAVAGPSSDPLADVTAAAAVTAPVGKLTSLVSSALTPVASPSGPVTDVVKAPTSLLGKVLAPVADVAAPVTGAVGDLVSKVPVVAPVAAAVSDVVAKVPFVPAPVQTLVKDAATGQTQTVSNVGNGDLVLEGEELGVEGISIVLSGGSTVTAKNWVIQDGRWIGVSFAWTGVPRKFVITDAAGNQYPTQGTIFGSSDISFPGIVSIDFRDSTPTDGGPTSEDSGPMMVVQAAPVGVAF